MSRPTSEDIQPEPASSSDEQAPNHLFRQQALDDQYRGIERLGRRLQLSSRWQLWPFRLLMVVLVAGLLFAIFGRLHDYASGVAIVRVGETAGPCEVRDDLPVSVLLLLPAHYLASVQPGMPLRLRLSGFPAVSITTTIEALGSEIVGPHSARQLLGERLSESLEVSGSLIPACARLSSDSFSANNRPIAYQDGMTGRGEVRLGSQRLIFALLPGLGSTSNQGDG